MRAAVIELELFAPYSQSLKEKRSLLRRVIARLDKVGSLSIAETNHHDAWQRATIGIAVVAGDATGLAVVVEKVRRLLDTALEMEVVSVAVTHIDTEN